jgi:uracil-DNA glycosylase
MIVFIGSNPSTRSGDCSAFNPETKSSKILNKWIQSLETKEDVSFINIADFKKDLNKPLSVSEIRSNLPNLIAKLGDCKDKKLIALGASASKAMSFLNMNYFSVPHPSGLNRRLNDVSYVKKMLEQMKEFISEKSSL